VGRARDPLTGHGPSRIRELLRPGYDGWAKFPHLPRSELPAPGGGPAAAGRDARAGQAGLAGEGVADVRTGGCGGAFAQAGVAVGER